MTEFLATDIFTPSGFPSYTYVERGEEKLEHRLEDALNTPGEVISISGPSKAGKTVLVEKVVGIDNLIIITGAGLQDSNQLWERVLDWMEAPTVTVNSEASNTASHGKGSVKAKGGIPFIAEGGGQVEVGIKKEKSLTNQSTYSRKGMEQVIKEIADSNFVLLIDDFHYMNRSIQSEVAQQIKEAARRKVKICAISVPHRADDVVRSNPELRGRVRAINIDYWKPFELRRIAEIGFPLLNIELSQQVIDKFVVESSGSPQLMQAICLQACFVINARKKREDPERIELDSEKIKEILFETSSRTDFGSLVRNMHTGPRMRGTERKEFHFNDTSRGDVYRCVLMSIATDPASLSFPYKELSERTQKVCVGDTPQTSSINQACIQICKMAEAMYPDQRVIEWDEDNYLLDVIDPYFLFYLRWSEKLHSLRAL